MINLTLCIQLEHSMLVQGEIAPPSDFPHEHTAPVAMRMPHLPITATTKTAELKGSPNSPSSPVGSRSSPVSEASSPGPSITSINQPQTIEESPIQSGIADCLTICFFSPIKNESRIIKFSCKYHNLQFPLSLLLLVSSVKTWTPTPIRALGSPRLQGEPCFLIYYIPRLRLQYCGHDSLLIFVFCREGKFSPC